MHEIQVALGMDLGHDTRACFWIIPSPLEGKPHRWHWKGLITFGFHVQFVQSRCDLNTLIFAKPVRVREESQEQSRERMPDSPDSHARNGLQAAAHASI